VNSTTALYLAVLLVFILKFQLRSRLLSWWDSAQFALALEHYNVVQHRPHPPGFPLYILWGKLLDYFTHDPNFSFVLLGLILSTLTAILIVRFVSSWLNSPTAGYIAGCLYAFAPLTIYHELKALTYVASAFFSILVAWESYRILFKKEGNGLRLAFFLGLMGWIRPFESILLIPLAIWAVSRQGTGRLIIGSIIYIFMQVAWIVPVAMLSGGFGPYWSELIAEGGKHERAIQSVIADPMHNLITCWGAIYYYLRQSFPFWAVFLIVPLISLIIGFKKHRKKAAFIILWIGPAMVLYSINYVNYAGILLFLSPTIALLIGSGLNNLTGFLERSRIKLLSYRFRQNEINKLLAVIIALHLLIIFFSVDIQLFGENHRKYDPDGFNYHRMLASDGYVYMLTDSVIELSDNLGGYDSVLIMSDLDYRVLMYYLPNHEVLWTRYLSQKESGSDGVTKLAKDRVDREIQLKPVEYKNAKYWIYELDGKKKTAVFTDEMLMNIASNERVSLLPGTSSAKVYMLDLDGKWGIFFRYDKFGTISYEMARQMGLAK
jgi:hypothetical protein